jgi:hypothetical protein
MSHDDFNFEPIRGLPEALPADEYILWQGRPNSLRLAKDAWSLNWVIGYFIALAVIRVISVSDMMSLTSAMAQGIPFLVAALTMTLNLPYVCIGNAQVALRKSGLGTITFELIGETRLSYLMTWPHVRPWYMSRTQPAFRSISDAERVAALFAEAAETRVSMPKVTQRGYSKTDSIAAE